MVDRTDVLVVGAGPTGLTLALQARAHGARVRVVDRRPEAFRPSRALILHARTLELLRPLGVTADLMARADTAPRVDLHLGRRVVPVQMAELAWRDTAFPHLTLVRQMDVETVLADALAERGVVVERATELEAVDDGPDGADAVLRTPAGRLDVRCRAVAGCDGVDSTVRGIAGIGWPGGTYDREVVLADLHVSELAPGGAHVVAGRHGLVFLFALGERAPWRLLATRAVRGPGLPAGSAGPPVPACELQRLLDDAGLDAQIDRVAWSSTVRLQHRVADGYRRGRLFLAGDAAHASSPAGGQGMNTGIHDATNLGWKLALAPGSTDPDGLLSSYEEERRPVDRGILGLTHLLFWAESATSPLPAFLRGTVAPWAAPVLPLLLRRRRLLAAAARLLAQLDVGYRGGRLATDCRPRRAARPRAGDRLPDRTVTSGGRELRLHELVAATGVHLLLDRDARTPDVPGPPLLHVHRLAGSPGRGVVAVRPDGHVGLTAAEVDDVALRAWMGAVGILGTG